MPDDAVVVERGSLGLRIDSELTTAILRVVAGVAMEVMWLVGGLPRGYPDLTRTVLPMALTYAVINLGLVSVLHRRQKGYPSVLTVGLTVADNTIILLISSLTANVSSPVVAILLLVVVTNAARFGIRVAVVVAVGDSVALAVLCLTVPLPRLPLDHRLQLLGWWTWLLVGGAVMAGVIARAALEAERARDVARRQVQAEHLVLESERQARLEVETIEAGRRDFLRVITHEMRTPITSLGALGRALSGGGDRLQPDERAEALGLLQSHAAHLERMLQSVGDLAGTDGRGRRDRVVTSDIALRELVASAAHASAVETERLAVDLGPGTETIRSDSEKLRRILTNLLENAGRHAEGIIDVTATIQGGTFTIRVMDRGPGLRPEVAARAFEKGFSFGPERGASGLGLWIVTDLAGVLGGRVWAESRPGGGLTVCVSLPLPGNASGPVETTAEAQLP